MNKIDSRTVTIQRDIYVSSEPQDSEWGQPPASHYILTVHGDRMLGQPIAEVHLPSLSSDELNDPILLEKIALGRKEYAETGGIPLEKLGEDLGL